MTNNLQLVRVCDGRGTPVTDKLNFKATYMLEDMINEQSLATICNFVAEYNPLQSFRLISTEHILIVCLI